MTTQLVAATPMIDVMATNRKQNKLALGINIIAFLLMGFIVTSEVQANPIGVQLPYRQFGHLANVGPLCAPTATANSFQFLVNKYPKVYGGTDLIRFDLESTRNGLAGGWVLPNGTIRHGMAPQGGANGACGASDQGWWETKVQWVRDFAPGTTVFGMIDENFAAWGGGDFLTRGVPTFKFLFNQLRDGEDVELGIQFAGGGAHAVTLTSLHFDDANGNGRWNPAKRELASIDYIDPNCPLGTDAASPRPSIAGLTLGADGMLHFPWVQGNGIVCNPSVDLPVDAGIYLAYSESPVPEPGTFIVFGAGLFGLLCADWRRRKRAA